MKVDVMNLEGQQVNTLELPADIFEAPIRPDLMHQAFVRQLANARLGTHKTKTRHEVSGSGKKPWKQKGTGRARQGSTRSAQWVGGGKIHTPRPRDYTQQMPRKMRRAALRSALSVKAGNSALLLVEGFQLDAPKTKVMQKAIEVFSQGASVLLLLPGDARFANTAKSATNLVSTTVLDAMYLNVRDILGHDKLVMPVEALEVISSYLGTESAE